MKLVPVRIALLLACVAFAGEASAHGGKQAASSGCCADPCMVQTVECVPETYKVKRITYKKVCKEETYTAYKCVCEPVTKTRTVCHYVRKPIYKNVTRTVHERVPVWTTKTVMKPHYTTKTVTEMRSKKVDKGHWVYRQVPAPFKTMMNNLKWRCSHDPCCDPCPPPPATRCVKRWCSNWVTVCCPVTVCKRVCEMRPCTVKCCTYKCVSRQVTSKVCTYVCEKQTRQETYTCNVMKKVPYQCKRTVVSCVPVEEWVTCTRMVRRTVCRPAPVSDCCDPCNTCCERPRRRLFSGLFRRGGGDCCGTAVECGGGCCGGGGCH